MIPMISMSDKTYELLKKKLVTSGPGDYLSARKLAQELGVGHTPVREALQRLSNEGYVKLIPHVGYFVVKLDIRAIIDIYKSRECVECYVLPHTVPTLTKEDVREMREDVRIQMEAVQNRDVVAFAKSDTRFHSRLVDRYGNAELTEFYRSIREKYLLCSEGIATSRSNISIDEHRVFLDAVEAKNYNQATLLMITHTQNALERIREGYIRIT